MKNKFLSFKLKVIVFIFLFSVYGAEMLAAKTTGDIHFLSKKERSVSIKSEKLGAGELVEENGKGKKYKKMELFWCEEFNGPVLDETSWVYDVGNGCPALCGWGNEELEHYSRKNVKLADGMLILTARGDGEGDKKYTSGRIKTEGKISIKYGRIDVRARLPKGKGMWPAIWMLGSSIRSVGWPVCGEIDIMELRGSMPNKVCGTVHYQNKKNRHEYAKAQCFTLESSDFSDDFHVFSIFWDKKQITWLVDDVPYMKLFFKDLNKEKDSKPFQNDFYFILNLAIGGRYDGNPTEETIFPQTMEVDYVRVYKKGKS